MAAAAAATIVGLLLLSLLRCSFQLQPYQQEALLRIKQRLKFPAELESWSENSDACNAQPNSYIALVCYEESLTQLHVTGHGLPRLSDDFSSPSLFSDLVQLPNLKVLSLVSLGLRGHLPPLIGNLSSLEILNVSSNHFDGFIPMEISRLQNLQTLIMDHNGFSGEVPFWLSELPVLSVVSLRNNSLSGSLPSSLSRCANLRAVVLSGNSLSGDLPSFYNLSNLQVVDVEDNQLGPHIPMLPRKLVSLVLRNNKFKYAKLHYLRPFFQLQKLDISMNQFVAPFVPSLLLLPSLRYLDFSSNGFTGKLSKNMSCSPGLQFVNLSANHLTGELPSCFQSRGMIVAYAGNCLSNKYRNQHPYSFCHNEALAVEILPHKSKKQLEKKKIGSTTSMLASSMVGGIVGGIVLLGLAFVVVRREYGKQKWDKGPLSKLIVDNVSPASTIKMLRDASNITETGKLGRSGLPPYRTFVLDELREATNDFSSSNLIGEGSHGQVYRGMLTDGSLVAIRSLKMRKRNNVHTYTHQLELISKVRHSHLVSTIGHCFDCSQDEPTVSKILVVFEYVPNGNLRSLISESHVGKQLTWPQRMAAALGVAKGIHFLHTGIVPAIVSSDFKITDILLDHDFHVKISKYNLPLLDETRRLDNGFVSSCGTKQKDGSRLRLEGKKDIHDFGVILLEIMVGRALNSSSDISVSNDLLQMNIKGDEAARRSIVDPSIHKDCCDASLKIMMELCAKCLSDVPAERPSIEDVLWNLQFAAQVHDSWARESCYSNHESPAHLASN